MNLLSKLKALFRRGQLDADMAEEMWQHLERRTQTNLASGMPSRPRPKQQTVVR